MFLYTDGTSHLGYMVIDVISREVVDLIGRDGKSKLTESKDFGVKSISGHDAGLGISLEDDVTLLSKEIGNYVLFGSVRDFYASLQCRCPCLDADVFSEEDLANKKLEELIKRQGD